MPGMHLVERRTQTIILQSIEDLNNHRRTCYILGSGIPRHSRNELWWSQGLCLWHARCREQEKSQSTLIDLGDQSDSRSVHTISPLNYSQTGSSTGSELSWDSKPALNSVYTPTPIETPEPLRHILNCNTHRDIVLKLNIAPVRQNRCFSRIEALLDSGANIEFIDRKWARIRKILLLLLLNPILVYNVDETCNSAGDITHYAEIVIDFQGHREKVVAEITNLGRHQMILGYMWLKHHNPDINWETGQVRMTHSPWTCKVLQGKSPLEQSIDALDQNSLRTIYAIKKEQERSEAPKPDPRPEDLVPKAYHKYLKVFSKKESECMPIRKPWDHTIDMKDTFVPKKGRLIPLSPQEQKEISDFIDDQTRKGYIRLSKSPQISPMFFVPKKDGKKQMV